MLIIYAEGTRGGMCQAVYRYAKANNKYMENCDRNIKSSFLEYVDANNLYGWAMSLKLPVRNFKWIEKDDMSKFDEEFIKNYEVNVDYPENIRMLHSDLAFLPERMKINKCTKLVCTTRNKENCVTHIRSLKQALNHGLKLTKIHRIIQFDQEACLKPYLI